MYKSATEYWQARKVREAKRKTLGLRPIATKTTFNLNAYCFCSGTSLAADKCDKCGKPPYTD